PEPGGTRLQVPPLQVPPPLLREEPSQSDSFRSSLRHRSPHDPAYRMKCATRNGGSILHRIELSRPSAGLVEASIDADPDGFLEKHGPGVVCSVGRCSVRV